VPKFLEKISAILESLLGQRNYEVVKLTFRDSVAVTAILVIILTASKLCTTVSDLIDPQGEFKELRPCLHYLHEGLLVLITLALTCSLAIHCWHVLIKRK
jgi:hypothetical protein